MSPARTPRRRLGLSTLVAVLGLLAVGGFVGFFQWTLSRQAAGGVHRIQLSAMARLQARSAIQELVAQVGRQANQPGTPLFEALRKVMDERWQVKDVTEHLRAPAMMLEPGWGKRGASRAEGRAAASIAEWGVRLRGSRRAVDVEASEEWTGVLTIRVLAEVGDAAATVRREIEENYEIRTILVGPPRPFDQLGLFLGRHDAAFDPSQVNAKRRQLLAQQRRLFTEVLKTRAPDLSPEAKEKLEGIVAGLLPADQVEERTPEVPEEPSALWGFYHVGRYHLEGLDPLREIGKVEPEIARYEAAARSAANGDALVDALYHLVDESSDAVNLLWDYQRVINLRPHDGEIYRTNVSPYLGRLTPQYYLDRAHLEIHPEDPVFQRWLRGEARLEGVLDLTRYGKPLELTGELFGRVILVVGEQGAVIDDLNQQSSLRDNRVVVVSVGGEVSVRGESHASILMLGTEADPSASPGTIRIPYSAKLTGNLIVPHPTRGALQLDGSIEPDPRLQAAYPPSETLEKAGRGDYLVAVSPRPLFAEGRAR